MKLRLVLGLMLILLVLRWLGCEPGAGRGPVKHLFNRIWVNKVADDQRDMVFHLALFGGMKKKTGFAMNASAFRFAGDLLYYRLDGDRLTLVVPQEDAKATFKARTYPCKGEAPKPFDLCLELKRGRQTIVLYSQRSSNLETAPAPVGLLGRPAGDADAACADCSDRLPTVFRFDSVD